MTTTDWRSGARHAIEIATEREPTLGRLGFDRGDWDLADDRHLLEVSAAIAWLRWHRVIATPDRDSYVAKHEAERWGARQGVPYVPMGAAIAAAIALGIPYRRHRRGPGADLGLSRKGRPIAHLYRGAIPLRLASSHLRRKDPDV